jgi:hypothetical protein
MRGRTSGGRKRDFQDQPGLGAKLLGWPSPVSVWEGRMKDHAASLLPKHTTNLSLRSGCFGEIKIEM